MSKQTNALEQGKIRIFGSSLTLPHLASFTIEKRVSGGKLDIGLDKALPVLPPLLLLLLFLSLFVALTMPITLSEPTESLE